MVRLCQWIGNSTDKNEAKKLFVFILFFSKIYLNNFGFFGEGGLVRIIFQLTHMTTQDTTSSQSESTEIGLTSKWQPIRRVATALGCSRPHIYSLIDRFRIRTVSLCEPGKIGSRFIDSQQLFELMDRLADEQQGRPRVRNRGSRPNKESAF